MPLAALIPHLWPKFPWNFGFNVDFGVLGAIPTCPSLPWCSTGGDPWETILEVLNWFDLCVDPSLCILQGLRDVISGFKLEEGAWNSLFSPLWDLRQGLPGKGSHGLVIYGNKWK